MEYSTDEPLYEQIFEDLKTQINAGHYPIGEKLPPEKTLMGTYKVSRITVQKAVNLLASEGIVTRRAGVGTTVLKKTELSPHKKMLGAILPGILESFGAKLLIGLTDAAAKKGYPLIIKFSGEDEDQENQCLQELLDAHVKGIFINPLQRSFYDPLLMQLILKKFPVVVIDKQLVGIDEVFAGTNHLASARQLAQQISALGHQNICVIGYHDVSNSTLAIRQEAFSQVYATTDYPLKASAFAHIIETTYAHHDGKNALAEDIQRIKDCIMTNKPTCLIVLDSYIGSLVREATMEMGLSVPLDIGIAGFDPNNDIIRSVRYTCIVQDEEAIAASAVDLMTKILTNKPLANRTVKLPSRYIDYGTVVNRGLMHVIP